MPHEASAILGIPLSCRCPPDKITWAYSPLGLFTTSSAYKLLVSGDAVSQAGSSNVDTQKHFWKGVWRLRVPNKIKHFIWRGCNDALPTMSNLFRRQITSSDSVNFANSAQKIRCMPSGLARMLRVLGAQSNASTNRVPPNP